jgi:SAM-dependent methyltransferase
MGCGSGRNAMLLSQLGCSTICIDKNMDSFNATKRAVRGTELSKTFKLLTPTRLNVIADPWPFATCAFGGIISVHFLHRSLLAIFRTALMPGGLLLIETVPGCGGNYLELPKAGELRAALEDVFEIRYCRERKVGPADHDSAVVHMLAMRKGK